MPALQPARGTQDLLPETQARHRHVSGTALGIAERYGYREIATPIFEFTEVFSRPIGATTDVVAKEMYTFTDRGGEEVTLRPEGTAGVARAVLSNGLTQSAPLKFFYSGPMFRYERPQKGRYRQFHQIGVELLGVPQPLADVETIALAAQILDELGVLGRTVLELNTLGDGESRQAYRDALVAYYQDCGNGLSEDSRRRLSHNPLRILDSKDPQDRQINETAPSFSEYLNGPSQEFFGRVTAGLDQLGIGYRLNPRLVRGLDYYTHTAFEFVTDALGAQGTVLGGGRYDGLIGLLGGPAMAGVGWAGGIERLAELSHAPPASIRPVAVIPVAAGDEPAALMLTQELRRAGVAVELGYSGNVGKRMKRADKLNARLALLIGEDEGARGAVILRDLDRGSQEEVPRAGIAARLAAAG